MDNQLDCGISICPAPVPQLLKGKLYLKPSFFVEILDFKDTFGDLKFSKSNLVI